MTIANRRLNICLITKMFPPRTGGGATITYELANALGERGHTVDVYTRSVSPEEDTTVSIHQNVSIIRVSKERPLVVLSTVHHSVAARRTIDFDAYDIVHGTLMPASTVSFGPLFIRSIDAPIILTSLGTAVGEALGNKPYTVTDYLFKYIFHPINFVFDGYSGRLADRIIGISHHTCNQLTNIYRHDKKKISLVPPGIDAKRFTPRDERHPAVDSNKITLLSVSRLDPRKGINITIRALAELDREDVELVIAGEGRIRSHLENLADELGVGTRVNFLGNVEYTSEELPRLYSSADLFVLPSRYEGFGVVYLEAMACGTPVIGTDVGGVPTVIKDGETGYLSSRDTEDVTDRISRILNDHEEHERMSDNARKWAESHDWDNIAAQVEDLYYEELGK